MLRTAIFANNIQALLAHQGLTAKEAALKWGMKFSVLERWSSAGVSHPHKTTMNEFQQLATQFGFDELWMLWEPWTPGNDGPDKAEKLIEEVKRRLDAMDSIERLKGLEFLKKLIESEDRASIAGRSVAISTAAEAVPGSESEFDRALIDDEFDIPELDDQDDDGIDFLAASA